MSKTSLYIHIPFCRRKCPYCSFPVCVSRLNKIDEYLEVLEREAEAYRGTSVGSVYVGGGTPSLLLSAQLSRLHKTIEDCFRFDPKQELCLEMNPEDVDHDKLNVLAECGYNRISLGVQSLSDHWLQYLGRGHKAAKVGAAFNLLREDGFKNINLDLMFGFPGQTEKELRKDVFLLCDMESEHVSLYGLTIEPQSRFYVQKRNLPSKREQARQYREVCRILGQRGFVQYEVSNFCRPGYFSRHNIHYWQGGDYIGLGLGAHSHRQGLRSWNEDGLRQYLRGTGCAGSEQLTREQRFWEAVVFGLRMNQGVSLKQLEQRLRYVPGRGKRERIRAFAECGLLVWQGENLKVTDRGRSVLDELSTYLV